MMIPRRKALIALGVGTASAGLLSACGSVGGTGGGASAGSAGSSNTMVTVVKVKGIAWFDRMEVGVLEWGKENGYDTRTEGGSDNAAEKQVQIIQDLIAQKPAAITVVPNSPEALSAVLSQARAQGITVVAHEATGIENVDADIESFDNKSYGEDIMKAIGEATGGEGQYVQFVGGLTAKTHMEWVEAAYNYQLANFPGMERVETPIESTDNETAAYEKAKEVLGKYPNIRAFQGSAGNDVPGIARAIEEAGLTDKVVVMGTSIPSAAKKYLEAGSIDRIFWWDPAAAGKAQLALAKILVDGGEITEGTDLGVEGYNSLKRLDGYDNVWVGAAQISADAAEAAKYDY